MLVGYARVSKADGSQTTDPQRDALMAAGVDPERIYQDLASGGRDDRPGMAECLKALRAGDTLLVWKLDRLGRDLRHLVNTVADLNSRGIDLKVLTGTGAAIDTTTPAGRLSFGIFAALAEFERELISERTKAGLASARARGRNGGRPAKMTPAKVRRRAHDYKRLDVANAAYRDVNMRTVVQSSLYFPFVEFMSAAAVVIVLWYGGSLIGGNTLEIGVLVAFIGYLNSFFDPLQQLSQLYNTFQASMAAVQKIYTVLDTEPDMLDAPDAVDLPDVRGEVRLRHVTFGYDPENPVLHDVDLTIPAGKAVALVGATGAGKSTVIKLLARFYDPTEGAVLIDGHDLRQVTASSLREQLAVVPQEAFLFSGSVLDNIRFARPTADTAEVKRVARIVGVHDFVESLPEGYDTEVQEGGSALSTGQRQLISFARALLADPKILILDEATSSVDAESERRIERAMDVLFSGRTSVIVAHRLSTVRYADEILVIDGGRVAERGTHDALVAAGGRYADLYAEWEATGEAL